jgi:hypothetical protein
VLIAVVLQTIYLGSRKESQRLVQGLELKTPLAYRHHTTGQLRASLNNTIIAAVSFTHLLNEDQTQ